MIVPIHNVPIHKETTMQPRIMIATLAALGSLSAPIGLGALGNATPASNASRGTTMAILGDTPYGDAQLGAFPALVASINADPKVRTITHVGDIKTGSSPCTTEYFETIRNQFDTFKDPLVYTPGDNEWTDCHRSAAGSYDPLERLDALRDVFFPSPGMTQGGHPRRVLSQAFDNDHGTYVENQRWRDKRVVFSMVHVVGSNNDLDPWFGTSETAEQRGRRLAEVSARTAAALDWIDETFDAATRSKAAGVALLMQADMWDAFSVANNLPLDGFTPIVHRIAERARKFGKPVLLLQGDSHQYLVDQPMAGGDPIHGVTEPVPNLTRIVVPGATATEWLRLNIDPQNPQVFSWDVIGV